MRTVAVVQARMGSTRLPGKVLVPLGEDFALAHVVRRISEATNIDEVVVATSEKQADDIIVWWAERTGVSVFRGDEADVLGRMYHAAERVQADEVVRITADCPLIAPSVIDEVVSQRRECGVEYAANIIDRTFPRGLDVEVFTFDSFGTVEELATDPAHREHVTVYYRDNLETFQLQSVPSTAVYDKKQFQNRTDLRLTLDEAADYKLLHRVFENVEYESTPSFPDVVTYIDEHGLSDINESVTQKSTRDASGN